MERSIPLSWQAPGAPPTLFDNPRLIVAQVHIGYEGYTSWAAQNCTPKNIRNTREIAAVYMRGTALDRRALAAKFKGGQ